MSSSSWELTSSSSKNDSTSAKSCPSLPSLPSSPFTPTDASSLVRKPTRPCSAPSLPETTRSPNPSTCQRRSPKPSSPSTPRPLRKTKTTWLAPSSSSTSCGRRAPGFGTEDKGRRAKFAALEKRRLSSVNRVNHVLFFYFFLLATRLVLLQLAHSPRLPLPCLPLAHYIAMRTTRSDRP